jgi:protein-disulfide isomerase
MPNTPPTSRPTSTAERAALALREAQAAERRRRFVIVAAVVAVLAVIGGLTWFAISRGDTTGKAVGESGTPAHTEGYAVVVGDANAPTTLKFYEDPQCPVCQQFESVVGDKVAQAVADGKVKVEYHIVSFLDRSSKNEYSSRAANALYAVADTAGPEAFEKFHDTLYQNQPQEGTAGPDDDQLVEWAAQAGAPETQVRTLIEDDTFGQFVENATGQMSEDGVTGTPGVFVNGTMATSPGEGVNAVLEAVK